MSTDTKRKVLIENLRELPAQLRAAVRGLTPAQLTTHYLAKEWTVAQNVHHLADSHMNAFIRMKILLTEECPPVKPYDPDAWAALPDGSQLPLEPSLILLEGLHARMVVLLTAVQPAQWERVAVHPERGEISLDRSLQIYGMHGIEHLKQIAEALAAAPA